MAGDVQQPFSLSFQVDALHSSSISFGRFDLQSLSWERRSSFSHNRYLEEVEKYAKPGSVTQKKAYFEAHFRKRALLRQASAAQGEGSNSDTSSSSTITCDDIHKDSIHLEESPQLMVDSGHRFHFDDSPKASSDGDFGVIEYEAGLPHNLRFESSAQSLPTLDNTNPATDIDTRLKNSSLSLTTDLSSGEPDYDRPSDSLELKQDHTLCTVYLAEKLKCDDNTEPKEVELTHDQDSVLNVQQNINLESGSNDPTPEVLEVQCVSGPSGCTSTGMINEHSKTVKPAEKTRSSGIGSGPGVDVLHNGNGEIKKEIARTNSWREKQSPLRPRPQKQMPETISLSLQSSLRQLKKEIPQKLKSKSLQTDTIREKEVRPKRTVTPQPSTPAKNESQRPQTAISSTRQIASYRKEIDQSVVNTNFRCSGRAEKEVRPKRAATPQPSTPGRSETQRPRSALSSTRQIASYRKEIGQSVMNTSFRSSGGSEKRREKIMPADIRQLSRKPDLKENPKLCPVSNTPLRVTNREKSQLIANNRSDAKASSRTLKPEVQTRTGSKVCSISRAVTGSKYAGSPVRSPLDKGTDVHKINDTNSSLLGRSRVIEANKRKEVVLTKEIVKERKPKAGQNRQIIKESLTEVRNKGEVGRSGHSFLRKSMGHSHSSVPDHHAATTRATPKVGGSGRIRNALFTKSMVH